MIRKIDVWDLSSEEIDILYAGLDWKWINASNILVDFPDEED